MIAFITDQHFGSKNNNKSIFETQMEFFEKQFFPFLIENNINIVISLGDLIHNRNSIDLWLLQQIKQRFFNFFENNKIKLYCILGNHDIYFNSELETNFFVENINEYKHISYIQKQEVLEYCGYKIILQPWIINGKNFEFTAGDILCGHFDMKNIPLSPTINSESGFDINDFKQYGMVLSGHYHNKSITKNIHYLGTQYQISWNDYKQEKGFYTFENGNLNFISNSISPKFLKVYYYENCNKQTFKVNGLETDLIEMNIINIIELAKNNYIRIIIEEFESQTDLDSFYNLVLSNSKNNYKIELINSAEIIEDLQFQELENEIQIDNNLLDVINSYLDGIKFDNSIDKMIILKNFKELYQNSILEIEL